MYLHNKELYRQFCKEEKSIPIFSRDWWLDAVCGNENWDVAIVKRNGVILGTLPFYLKRMYGFRIITMPPLTQTLGPWIRPSKAKYARQLAFQKDVMTELIGQLPPFDYFKQTFHYSITNWLPFYWMNFQQKTDYTYVLEDLSDENMLWGMMENSIRSDIRKAKDREGLTVRTDLEINDFLDLNEKTFSRQKLKFPVNHSIVLRLDRSCIENKCRRIFIAEDQHGRRHAGIYLVWDENSAYYLMGGADPELRNSGAGALLMWEALTFSATVTLKFDFEGSMIESIEHYFRSFGGQQKSCLNLSKTNSVLLKIYLFLKLFV